MQRTARLAMLLHNARTPRCMVNLLTPWAGGSERPLASGLAAAPLACVVALQPIMESGMHSDVQEYVGMRGILAILPPHHLNGRAPLGASRVPTPVAMIILAIRQVRYCQCCGRRRALATPSPYMRGCVAHRCHCHGSHAACPQHAQATEGGAVTAPQLLVLALAPPRRWPLSQLPGAG